MGGLSMLDIVFPRLYAAYVAYFTDDLPFWQQLAASSDGPFLELGCGPGRVLHFLAERGFHGTGMDNDQGMLEWARLHAIPPFEDKIDLVYADMCHFTFQEPYSLIIVPCNTFAYFDENSALQILESVNHNLTPDGKVAIVIPNIEGKQSPEMLYGDEDLWDSEPAFQYFEPISEHPIQVYARHQLEAEGSTLHVTWSFDELFPDGNVHRTIHKVTYHLRSIQETARLLHQSGLTLIVIYGDYDFGALDPESYELILLAKKSS
jgi:SAM-dependent methyltransferase